jgi:type 1 glutamine amidotransferase
MHRGRFIAGTLLAGAALTLATPGGPAVAGEGKRARLLVVTVTSEYRHEVIPVMVGLIERLGRESGLYTMDRADTNEELQAKTTPEALSGYDAVVFANTDSDVPVADREAFLAWVEGGGALVGIHGASVVRGWPEYTALLGGQFDFHPDEHQTVQVWVTDPNHPATQGRPSPFEVHDEIYLFKGFDRTRVHMLLSLDRHPKTGEPGFYPYAWTREQGQGRVFYTAAGHREDVVESEWFASHLLGGIRWALAG